MFFSRNKTDLKKNIYILIIHLGFKVKNSHFITKYSFDFEYIWLFIILSNDLGLSGSKLLYEISNTYIFN